MVYHTPRFPLFVRSSFHISPLTHTHTHTYIRIPIPILIHIRLSMLVGCSMLIHLMCLLVIWIGSMGHTGFVHLDF